VFPPPPLKTKGEKLLTKYPSLEYRDDHPNFRNQSLLEALKTFRH
jgi:hypothetical protein